jgi:hypothetical protein
MRRGPVSKFAGDRCLATEHRWARPVVVGARCHCGDQILCAQCYRGRPKALFTRAKGAPGYTKNCHECKRTYSQPYGERAAQPRRALRVIASEPRVTWSARSGNQKLGAIGAATVSAETCPPACGFYGRGCFAEFGVLGHHWRRTQDTGLTWADFLGRVRAVPAGELWRYAVAGDLPGQGDRIDLALLSGLVRANEGRRGFGFTHKPLSGVGELAAVRAANAAGFTVNLSADTLAQADARADLGAGPVVVVLPLDAPHKLRTPAGRHVVVCPAESKGLDCKRCGLCAVSSRKAIVGFRAHGQMQKTVSKIASGAASPSAADDSDSDRGTFGQLRTTEGAEQGG